MFKLYLGDMCPVQDSTTVNFAGCHICIAAFPHHVLKETIATQFICAPVRTLPEIVPQAITYTTSPVLRFTVMTDACPRSPQVAI